MLVSNNPKLDQSEELFKYLLKNLEYRKLTPIQIKEVLYIARGYNINMTAEKRFRQVSSIKFNRCQIHKKLGKRGHNAIMRFCFDLLLPDLKFHIDKWLKENE